MANIKKRIAKTGLTLVRYSFVFIIFPDSKKVKQIFSYVQYRFHLSHTENKSKRKELVKQYSALQGTFLLWKQ